MFEEYGSTDPNNKTVIVQPWQQTTLGETSYVYPLLFQQRKLHVNEKADQLSACSIAYDSFWQFATTLSIDPFDSYALYYNTTPYSDYQVLAVQHAAAMLAKNPVATQ